MKVKELIKELKNCDQKAEVIVQTNNTMEQGQSQVKASYVSKSKGRIVQQRFRDAFDGGEYTTSVVKTDDDGDLDFVSITG